MSTYVGRLAPSPTGLLHLGHAATFWTAYRRAIDGGGRLLLRVDDLDQERSRPEFATAMLEDLRWLGIAWEEPAVTQSERLAAYRAALDRLLLAGAVYACSCSRKELQAAVSAPHEESAIEPVYGGRCRPVERMQKGLFRAGVNYRFRVPDGAEVRFRDGDSGPQSFRCGCDPGADVGDFLVWRRDGLPSYQLACAVDDAAMGITEVVRGRDLLRSTARQILLGRALDLAMPGYFHTALVRDDLGVRLAKRHDALALRTLRDSGLKPADVLTKFSGNPDRGREVAHPTEQRRFR